MNTQTSDASKIEALFNEIMSLTHSEVIALATMIKNNCDIDLSSMTGMSGNSIEQEDSTEEKLYNVSVVSIGAEKIKAMKSIRDVLKATLMEAKSIVENVPYVIKEGISKEAADVLVKAFQDQTYKDLEFKIEVSK